MTPAQPTYTNNDQKDIMTNNQVTGIGDAAILEAIRIANERLGSHAGRLSTTDDIQLGQCSDLDLLKLAAKAADIQVEFDSDGNLVVKGSELVHWNPLKNDGDAFRLATKLKINMIFSGKSRYYVGTRNPVYDICSEGNDKEIRYSIVYEAAKIGKAMK